LIGYSASSGATSPSSTVSVTDPTLLYTIYFAELYAEYGDEISLVAIHSNLVTDDVDKFLAKPRS